MKKLILFFSLTALAFASCSKDDGTPTQDPFIGTWTLSKAFENGVEYALDDCEKKNTVVVRADGTITSTSYVEDSGTCKIDEDISGTWKNLGNSIYQTTFGNNVLSAKVTFDNNTFTSEEVEGSDTYKDIYIKS